MAVCVLNDMFEIAIFFNDLWFAAKGVGMALNVTNVSLAAGTLMGVIFALFRAQFGLYWSAPLMFLFDIFWSVPLLNQLVLADAIQAIAKFGGNPFPKSGVMLLLCTAAFCTEITYCGIDAVLVTTRRTARTLGLTCAPECGPVGHPRIAARMNWPDAGWDLGLRTDVMVWADTAVEVIADPCHPVARAAVHLVNWRHDLFSDQLRHCPTGWVS